MSCGLPLWHSGQEPVCRCGGHRFDPWSGKISHAAEQLRLCTTMTKPTLYSLRAEYWSPCSTAREATSMRSPHMATKSSPHSLQLEKPMRCNEDPGPKTNECKNWWIVWHVSYVNKAVMKKSDIYIYGMLIKHSSRPGTMLSKVKSLSRYFLS